MLPGPTVSDAHAELKCCLTQLCIVCQHRITIVKRSHQTCTHVLVHTSVCVCLWGNVTRLTQLMFYTCSTVQHANQCVLITAEHASRRHRMRDLFLECVLYMLVGPCMQIFRHSVILLCTKCVVYVTCNYLIHISGEYAN